MVEINNQPKQAKGHFFLGMPHSKGIKTSSMLNM
jgi:hypothetical protein